MTNSKKTPGPLARYWTDYGGWPALVASRYVWVSFALTIVLYPEWTVEKWWDDVLYVNPSVLGFSLAAYAMLIAFPSENFLKIITNPVRRSESANPTSAYTSTSAAFVHFVLIQVVALMASLICKAWNIPVYKPMVSLLGFFHISTNAYIFVTKFAWFLSYWLFIYGIFCSLAGTLRIFMLAKWFAIHAQKPEPDNQETTRL